MKSISLVIITFNEEANIEQCIKSTGDIADEIIVVDSFSTDKTCEIATACGARVLQHKFEGHVQQKNWAKEQARCDWVLSLDADETLDSVLFSEIKKWKHIEQYHTRA
ncbi:MAG: glycosyltransferase family 2 protein [Bacteroidetes bacterium]|nr:glycosyltransferase family 2 protein [Bacteroidota bacterium]